MKSIKKAVALKYPDGVEATPDKFNKRNRIISAISEKLLVVEAHLYSGTMLTVNHSLALGKEIYCIPDQIFNESGCNKLIKEGAHLVETIDDIV